MFPTTDTTRAGRMMAAGRVTVTFRSPSGQHITVAAKARKKDGERWVGCPLDEAMVVFIEIPNQGGWGDKVGKVTRARGFVADPRADQARVYCGRMLLRFVAGQALSEGLEAYEESACGRCGRALTDPVSIERGIGPECYGRMTGSEHQTKIKTTDAVGAGRGQGERGTQEGSTPSATADTRSENVPVETLDAAFRRVPGTGVEAARDGRTRPASDGRDKQGVAFGHGDWRARKEVARQIIQGETSAEKSKREADEAFARGCNRDDLYENGIPY